jgi:16S rRNA processing protein RimM
VPAVTAGAPAQPLVAIGRIGAAHGIKGWVRVWSYTDPPEALLDYAGWQLRGADGRLRSCEVRDTELDGRGIRLALAGCEDRNAAEALRGLDIVVPRAELPPTAEREHYREDLLGFAVVNLGGETLGTLDHFVDGAAEPLMAVRNGEQERWIPAAPSHLRRVLMAERRLVVDWPSDF